MDRTTTDLQHVANQEECDGFIQNLLIREAALLAKLLLAKHGIQQRLGLTYCLKCQSANISIWNETFVGLPDELGLLNPVAQKATASMSETSTKVIKFVEVNQVKPTEFWKF
jgi:hypothetical protein